MDGVLQAAGLPDDGYGAIPHGDHLAQTARFALGGHQEQVGTGVNGHGQSLVVVQAHGHAAAVLLGGPVEELLISLVSLAKDHQLHRELHNIMENLANQVQTFVGDQTADHGQNGGTGLLSQAQHPLQGGLVLRLAAHVLRGVPGCDPLVGGGVVELHVDAVEHAIQLIVALADNILQPVGEVGHFQLVGVGGGDGVDSVGAEDGTLQQVHVPVHDDGTVVGPALVQAEQIAQGLHTVAALVLDVVDGQGGLDGAEAVLPHAVILQIDGHQGGLPVVAVDDLRPEFQVAQHPHDGPGEEAEALAVVHVAVQVRAVEVLLVVQEVPGDAVPLQ